MYKIEKTFYNYQLSQMEIYPQEISLMFEELNKITIAGNAVHTLKQLNK